MNVSGPWPIPKTFRSCNASSSKPGAGLSRTTTCTRLAEPSAASSLFNRSAAFTTLPARSGPDGSWRDQSSSFTVFCASARVAATIDAAEQPANAAAASSATFPVFQWSIVALPSLCDALHRAVVLCYCTAVQRDYEGLRCNDPARTGPGEWPEPSWPPTSPVPGTCDRNPIAYALEPSCPRGRARPNLRSPGLQPPLPRE